MRKHVTPADPGASIPDLVHGGNLPTTGLDVEFTGYWSLLAQRGDIIVTDVEDAGGGTPAPVAPAVQLTDVIPGLRDGEGHLITVADLAAFLGPLQEDSDTPAGLSPIVAALIFG